jgi:hypothetical protein
MHMLEILIWDVSNDNFFDVDDKYDKLVSGSTDIWDTHMERSNNTELFKVASR